MEVKARLKRNVTEDGFLVATFGVVHSNDKGMFDIKRMKDEYLECEKDGCNSHIVVFKTNGGSISFSYEDITTDIWDFKYYGLKGENNMIKITIENKADGTKQIIECDAYALASVEGLGTEDETIYTAIDMAFEADLDIRDLADALVERVLEDNEEIDEDFDDPCECCGCDCCCDCDEFGDGDDEEDIKDFIEWLFS